MNVQPLADRILVRRIEEKETMRGGIIIPDTAKEKPQEGEVVAVGPGRMTEDGKRIADGGQEGRPHPDRQVLGHRGEDRRRRVRDPARGRRARPCVGK